MVENDQTTMDENLDYGAICLDGDWRIFGEGYPIMWALDLTNADPVAFPNERQSCIRIDRDNIGGYFAMLEEEISLSQIQSAVEKIPLSYVINFDRQLFVDGGPDGGEIYHLSQLFPKAWRTLWRRQSDALYHVPNEIRTLWIDKKTRFVDDPPTDEVIIYPYTDVGAVKHHGTWRFFFEQRWVWKLDFAAFMGEGWPERRGDTDLRTNLPNVDENNAADFIRMLSDYELAIDEIPRLVYYLTEDDRYLLHRESGLAKVFPWIMRKPDIRHLVNFDEKVHVRKPLYGQSQFDVDPVEEHAPRHWTCHVDYPIHYIPPELAGLWPAT